MTMVAGACLCQRHLHCEPSLAVFVCGNSFIPAATSIWKFLMFRWQIIAQRVSLNIGRMQVCLMFKIFGILLLCLMGLENAWWKTVWTMICRLMRWLERWRWWRCRWYRTCWYVDDYVEGVYIHILEYFIPWQSLSGYHHRPDFHHPNSFHELNSTGTIFSFSSFFLQADMLFSKLLKSVTFDFVTKADRAKWASLDSISRFG